MLGLIHCHVWGAYKVSSLCGAHYFFTIFDDASQSISVYIMREKGEASLLLQNFVIMVKTQFEKDMKIIRSDNGLKFLSGPMKQFEKDMKII